MVPRRVEVPFIITARPERERNSTVRQLREIGCRYGQLVMRPDNLDETEIAFAYFKSSEFLRSGCELFIESSKLQAELIHIETLKPVACPREGQVYQLERSPLVPAMAGWTPVNGRMPIPPFEATAPTASRE